MYANCVLARRVSLLSLRPIPQWAALEGCTAVALMAKHDDARQASRQCARICGALTRVRRACLSKKVFAKHKKKERPLLKPKIFPPMKCFGASERMLAGRRNYLHVLVAACACVSAVDAYVLPPAVLPRAVAKTKIEGGNTKPFPRRRPWPMLRVRTTQAMCAAPPPTDLFIFGVGYTGLAVARWHPNLSALGSGFTLICTCREGTHQPAH